MTSKYNLKPICKYISLFMLTNFVVKVFIKCTWAGAAWVPSLKPQHQNLFLFAINICFKFCNSTYAAQILQPKLYHSSKTAQIHHDNHKLGPKNVFNKVNVNLFLWSAHFCSFSLKIVYWSFHVHYCTYRKIIKWW